MIRFFGYARALDTIIQTTGITAGPAASAPYPGVACRVYNTGTEVLATIYSSDDQAFKPNPFSVNTDGQFTFYGPEDTYDLLFSTGVVEIPVVEEISAPSYLDAVFPEADALTIGRLARRSDGMGGLWMDSGNEWVAVNGGTIDFRSLGGRPGVDNTDALTNALAALEDGSTLRFSKGTYAISGASSFTVTGKSIALACDPDAIIDATGVTVAQGIPIFDFQGSMGTWSLLGASPSKGARTITLSASLAATLSEGDLVRLSTSPTAGGSGETWRGLGSTNYKGEIVEVQSVSGQTVALKNALADSYTAANTGAAKMTAFSVRLDNFTLKADVAKAQIGLRAKYVRSATVIGGSIDGTSHTALQLEYAARGFIAGYHASNFWKAGVGNNYGLCLASCQNVTVTGCNISGGRHAITTGGVEPNRWVVIAHSTLDSDTAGGEAGLFLHDNSESVRIVGNVLKAGVAYADAIRVVIEGNDIAAPSTTVAGVNIAKSFADDAVIVRNNQIHVDSGLASNVPLITISAQAAVSIDSIMVSGNDLRGNSAGISIAQATTGTFTIRDLDISKNTVVIGSTRRPLSVVGFGNSNRAAIDVLTVHGNRIEGADTVLLNHAFADTGTLSLQHNRFRHTGAGGSTPILAANSLTLLRALFLGNEVRCDTQETAVTVTASDYINAQNNSLLGFSDADGLALTASTVVNTNNYRTA